MARIYSYLFADSLFFLGTLYFFQRRHKQGNFYSSFFFTKWLRLRLWSRLRERGFTCTSPIVSLRISPATSWKKTCCQKLWLNMSCVWQLKALGCISEEKSVVLYTLVIQIVALIWFPCLHIAINLFHYHYEQLWKSIVLHTWPRLRSLQTRISRAPRLQIWKILRQKCCK